VKPSDVLTAAEQWIEEDVVRQLERADRLPTGYAELTGSGELQYTGHYVYAMQDGSLRVEATLYGEIEVEVEREVRKEEGDSDTRGAVQSWTVENCDVFLGSVDRAPPRLLAVARYISSDQHRLSTSKAGTMSVRCSLRGGDGAETRPTGNAAVRDMNEPVALDLFLNAHLYECAHQTKSGLPQSRYFAPHLGWKLARSTPSIRRGFSYIAKIEDVSVCAGSFELRELLRQRRGPDWLKKHQERLDAFDRRWRWRKNVRRSVVLLGRPRPVFNPPVPKESVQTGRGFLNKRSVSFDELFTGWEGLRHRSGAVRTPRRTLSQNHQAEVRSLVPMRHLFRILFGTLVVGILLDCAMSPAEREATERAWAARDAEKAPECVRRGGMWSTAGCLFKGGP
jgi:hypothetical protein